MLKVLLRFPEWPQDKWLEYPDKNAYFKAQLLLDFMIAADLNWTGIEFSDEFDGVRWLVRIQHSDKHVVNTTTETL